MNVTEELRTEKDENTRLSNNLASIMKVKDLPCWVIFFPT